MNEAIKVLDHGLVRLVESMGSDLSIVRNARVSYNAEWRTGEDEGKDAKLLNYLVKNKHTSPFESCVFTFEVKAPIFVFRQWHRHRIGRAKILVHGRFEARGQGLTPSGTATAHGASTRSARATPSCRRSSMCRRWRKSRRSPHPTSR